MSDTAIKIEHVSKEYRLGAIGGTTLRDDLQRLHARLHGREDPTAKIGAQSGKTGERFLALDDVSFQVKKGEALGIIGHNGAGKSTLLKLLSRVTAPTSGTISYNGRVASMLEVGTGFHPELTGRENVYMNGAILGMTRAEITRKFDEIVSFAEMEKFIDTPVKRYSSGMYVKLAFAVAAHLDSEIMVMDEVLAVGDMKFQQKCLGKMGDAAANDGRTVLYVSHNMNTIRKLCSRCVVLDHGRVKFDGDTETAIGIYMDANRFAGAFRSYTDYKRPSWLQRDELRVVSAEYVGKDDNCFAAGEAVKIRFNLLYPHEIENIGLRFEIWDRAQAPIATSVITELPVKASDEMQEITLEYHLDGLVAGEYKSFFTFFTKNTFGTNRDVDCVPGLEITVQDNQTQNYIEWNANYWGHIRFETPHIIGESR